MRLAFVERAFVYTSSCFARLSPMKRNALIDGADAHAMRETRYVETSSRPKSKRSCPSLELVRANFACALRDAL